MLIALFILAIYRLCTQAAPVLPPGGTSEAATECQQFRTIWSIIWSCLFTLFACTWTAVHPNLPGPNEGALAVLWTKIKLVLLALVAPEYILFWALAQRLKAKDVLDMAKESDSEDAQLSQWTLSHGFLAVMGGFVAENKSGEPLYAVVPGQYGMEFGHFRFPKVTEQQIQDRSKSDAFSKLVAIAQFAWFLTQCIARGVRGLAVTELELITTAYALTAVLTYIAWWHKPMGMRCYIPVTFAMGDLSFRYMYKQEIPTGFAAKLFFTALQNITLEKGQIKVPILFSGGRYPVGEPERALCQEFAVGVLFGAVHCIGWRFPFLSRAERLLWRISSVGITAYPAIGLTWLLISVVTGRDPGSLPLVVTVPGYFFTVLVGPPLYVIFRLIIIVLPFLALRQLPASTYQNVRWTSFIPHIG